MEDKAMGISYCPGCGNIYSFMFDGDDPYVICSCGKRIDNLTGKELVASAMQAAEQEAERMFTQADVNQQVIQALETLRNKAEGGYTVKQLEKYSPLGVVAKPVVSLSVIDNLIKEYKGE